MWSGGGDRGAPRGPAAAVPLAEQAVNSGDNDREPLSPASVSPLGAHDRRPYNPQTASGGLTCPFAPMIWPPGCPAFSRPGFSSCQSRPRVGKPAKSSIRCRKEIIRPSSRTGGSFPTARLSSRCGTCGPRTEDSRHCADGIGMANARLTLPLKLNPHANAIFPGFR